MRNLGLLLIALLALHTASARAEMVLHRGNRLEPATLDPQKVNTEYENAIVGDLFEGLLARDAEGRPTLGIADSWSASADGKRYTFHLRPHLVWSDGSALTPDGVVASFRRLMAPATAARYAQFLEMLANGPAVIKGEVPPEKLGVHVADAETVTFELDSPAPYFPELLADPFAAIVPVALIAREGDGWTKPGVMISNGAFQLSAWEREDRIVLARNPRFHDADSVKLDQVIYYPSADAAAAIDRYRSGEFDMVTDLPSSQIDDLRDRFGAEVHLDPALVTYYLAVNTALKKFADSGVRRALSLAIDRNILATKVLHSGERPAYSFVPPTTANAVPAPVDFAGWAMDQRLAEARAQLKEAGFDAAHPLEITLSYTTNQELRRLAVVIAGMWQQIGVRTILANVEGKVHFSNLRQGAYEVGLVAWIADVDDASDFLHVLRSDAVNSNYSRFRNSDFDDLMDRAAESAQTVERAGLLHDAEGLAMAAQPVIPLYFGTSRNLVAKRVAGWQPNPTDVHLSRYLSIERTPG